MTRIKYLKNGNLLVSKEILCDINVAIVTLITNTGLGSITLDGKPHMSFCGSTLSSLKKNAKNHLISLGAKFDQEIRNRGNTEKLDLEKL